MDLDTVGFMLFLIGSINLIIGKNMHDNPLTIDGYSLLIITAIIFITTKGKLVIDAIKNC